MSDKFNENEWISVLLLYLIPILGWIIYTYQNTPLEYSWVVSGIGFAILFFCSALLISLLKKQPVLVAEPMIPVVQEPRPFIPEEPPQEDLSKEWMEKIELLQTHLQEKESALAQALNENHEMAEKIQEIRESAALNEEEARRKIESLELEVHQTGQAAKQFENQINDLRYEIKTLLNLTEVGPEPIKDVPLEPVQEVIAPKPQAGTRGLLTRCVDAAQKITAGYHTSSLRGLSLDPYAFDLRRLQDALRQESGALILVYSPKEERVLFANAETKNLLGISPEQFAQDFADFAAEDFPKWKSAVLQLLTKSEVRIPIQFKDKSGDKVLLNAQIASIPTGVFRSLIIATLS